MGSGVPQTQIARQKCIMNIWHILLLHTMISLGCDAHNWPPCACVENRLYCTFDLTYLRQNRTCIAASLVNMRHMDLQSFPGDLNTFGSAQVVHDCMNDKICGHNDAVNELCALSVVDVSNNKMKELPSLPNVCALAVINAANNRITSINENFGVCRALEGLNLAGNEISSLPGTGFRGLKKLRVLDLSDNPLQGLSDIVFADLSELEILRLSNSHLAFLTEELFANLHKLSILDLSNNNIIFLRKNIFTGLRNLHFLDLHKNRIRHVSAGVFRNQNELVQIDLNSNRMKYLPDKVFFGLTSLETLWLRNNSLKELPALGTMFPNLKVAHLENNSIYSFSKHQILKAACGSSMRAVNLDGNPILGQANWFNGSEMEDKKNDSEVGNGCHKMKVRNCRNSTLKFCTVVLTSLTSKFYRLRLSYNITEKLNSWSLCQYVKDIPLAIFILPVIGLYLLGKEILQRKDVSPARFATYHKDIQRY